MLAFLCARALWATELPPAVLVLLLVVVATIAVLDHREQCRVSTLFLDARDTWHLEQDGLARFSGKLLDAGTRGARSVTLVFEIVERPARTESFNSARTQGFRMSTRRRLHVHADSIDDKDFSFLHLQLMLAGDPELPYAGAGAAAGAAAAS